MEGLPLSVCGCGLLFFSLSLYHLSERQEGAEEEEEEEEEEEDI
jgi:hypothetical protein